VQQAEEPRRHGDAEAAGRIAQHDRAQVGGMEIEFGREYFVAPDGKDSAGGRTANDAWSLAKVAQFPFKPGDRVILQGGATYHGTLEIGVNASGVTFEARGGIATIDARTADAQAACT